MFFLLSRSKVRKLQIPGKSFFCSLIKTIFKYRLVFLSKSINDEFGLYPYGGTN